MVLNVRNLVAWCYGIYLLSSGKIRKLKEKSKNGDFILSVYFHNPSKKLFEQSVKWFLKNGFTFISVKDLITIKEKKIGFPPMAVIFTVDDGWKENQQNIFEIAEKYQIPVTTFIATEPVEEGTLFWWSYVNIALKKKWQVPSVSEMKKLKNQNRLDFINDIKSKINKQERDALLPKDLINYQHSSYIHFGSHTVTHPILSNCTSEVAHFEITQSQKILQNWLHYPINSFAYPNGNYTEREIAILKDNGYKIAFNTVPQYLTPDKMNNIYEIPRFDVLEDVSFVENICRMTGLWFERKKLK
jgi:peptidoglycan/xylan/chitin deacetylase (PgdA/CDA1 family)